MKKIGDEIKVGDVVDVKREDPSEGNSGCVFCGEKSLHLMIHAYKCGLSGMWDSGGLRITNMCERYKPALIFKEKFNFLEDLKSNTK
jgi:hypothetical protein